jgi:hypothetical protein
MVGHVDSRAGPGVFWRLRDLRPQQLIVVTRADARVVTFAVDRVERYPKGDFPTVRVYGNTDGQVGLRLITCGGVFDRSTGHYRDNVVVFAHLVAVSRP